MSEAPGRAQQALIAGVIGLAMTLAWSLPRSMAYGELLDENLTLKAHLQELDHKMSEVDRILLRLRLYDAQLKSLGEPKGDHGPLPPEAYANYRLTQDGPDPEGVDGVPMEDEGWVTPEDLRPAEAWALAVDARATTFLAHIEASEPNVNALVEELEGLRALELALPQRWPVQGDLTSGFGWRRNPFGRRYWRFHSGIDVASRRGAPIYAPAAGKVVRADWTGGYGRYIEIDHGYGIMTSYGHCTNLYVNDGDEVAPGDLIATVGTTGRSTGPHLHFEVRLDGHAVDPLDYLPR